MRIYVETTTQLAEVCAQLVREGITFHAQKNEQTGLWLIELKGY